MGPPEFAVSPGHVESSERKYRTSIQERSGAGDELYKLETMGIDKIAQRGECGMRGEDLGLLWRTPALKVLASGE